MKNNVFLVVLMSAAVASAYDPPVEAPKFVAYSPQVSDQSLWVHAEIKGIVVLIEGSELYIRPDDNYDYMMLWGNKTIPDLGEAECCNDDGTSCNQLCGTTEAIHENLEALGLTHTGIINVEARGYGPNDCGNPDSTCASGNGCCVGVWPGMNAGQAPWLRDPSGPLNRRVEVGDHIRLRGQFVIDYGHPYWSKYYTTSAILWNGSYQLGHAHTELHPYDDATTFNVNPPASDAVVELIPADRAPNYLGRGDVRTERHTIFTPVYTDAYTCTWGWNKANFIDCRLNDGHLQMTRTINYSIPTPPPMACLFGVCDYDVKVTYPFGAPPTAPAQTPTQDKLDVSVTVTATTADPGYTDTYLADYRLQWFDTGAPKLQPTYAGWGFGSFADGHGSAATAIPSPSAGMNSVINFSERAGELWASYWLDASGWQSVRVDRNPGFPPFPDPYGAGCV